MGSVNVFDYIRFRWQCIEIQLDRVYSKIAQTSVSDENAAPTVAKCVFVRLIRLLAFSILGQSITMRIRVRKCICYNDRFSNCKHT